MSYLESVNSGFLYMLVAGILTFVVVMCLVFLFKSYNEGKKIGMDEKILKKVIVSSATFTLLPSISILLGVIALSGTLGVPFSWLRLSVIGALQYELNVAAIAAESLGLSLTVAELNMGAFVTIALVMTIGIVGGIVCCTLFLKKYLSKIQSNPKKEKSDKPGFGAHATTAMFVGLCAAYIGSYVGQMMPTGGSNIMPIIVAGIAAVIMCIFEFLIQKKNMKELENFSLAASMLIAMVGAVLVSTII